MSNDKGNKAYNRQFVKCGSNLYEYYGITDNDNMVILRQLFSEGNLVSVSNDVFVEKYEFISKDDLFTFIDDSNDEIHTEMLKRIGIGYICPFCGGYLRWESDYMTSECHGLEYNYEKITDECELDDIKRRESELIRIGIMGETYDIESIMADFEHSGDYDKMMYKYTDTQGNVEYYEIDDPVIGLYTCNECGKHYEIQDPYRNER